MFIHELPPKRQTFDMSNKNIVAKNEAKMKTYLLFYFKLGIICWGPSGIGGLMSSDFQIYVSSPQQNISPHFTFEELTRTSKIPYKLLNPLLAKDYLFNLTLLANYLLEPVRSILNAPLLITSAYRCKELNKAVGGSETSQHLTATAADFKPKHISLEEAFFRLKNSPFLHYGQLILEKSWIHISLGVPFRELNKCYESFKIL